MAGVLPHCQHEVDNAKLERMASPPDKDVHMEAMEEAQNEGDKPEEAGDS